MQETLAATRRPIVAYVAGYGHSGSTLVDRVLGNHPQVLGCGEVIVIFENHLRDLDVDGSRCPCGQPASECAVWGRVRLALQGAVDDPARAQAWEEARSRIESFGGLWRILAPVLARGAREQYRSLMELAMGALSEGLGQEQHVILDSSKSGRDSVWRPVALARLCNLDVRVIHIVRDPRGVLWSLFKAKARNAADPGSGDALARPSFGLALRTLCGWLFSNSCATLLRLLMGSGQYRRVSYEDLTAEPEREFGELARFLDLEPAYLPAGQASEVPAGGHQLQGNRMRYSPRVRIRPDHEWQSRLHPGYRALAGVLTWPWRAAYR